MLVRVVFIYLVLTGLLYASNPCQQFISLKQPISLEVSQLPVSSLFEKMAHIASVNIILPPKLTRLISLSFTKIPWWQAFRAAARAANLSYSCHQLVLTLLQSDHDSTKLTTQSISIHYLAAANIAKTLSQVGLPSTVSIVVDQSANALIVTAKKPEITVLKSLVLSIDKPLPAIEIKARVVVVNQDALTAFGINLKQVSEQSVGKVGISQIMLGLGVLHPAGSVGLMLGKLAGGMLNLEIQALQKEGQAKVIASPSVQVDDNQTAKIQQGDEIPFDVATESGATAVQFKKAVLSLAVTPHVIHQHILLAVTVTNDALTQRTANAGKVPVIRTDEIQTQLQVPEGKTVVIGGIQSSLKQSFVKAVPVLHDIPLIGSLFEHKENVTRQAKLLIFLTPKLVEETKKNGTTFSTF